MPMQGERLLAASLLQLHTLMIYELGTIQVPHSQYLYFAVLCSSVMIYFIYFGEQVTLNLICMPSLVSNSCQMLFFFNFSSRLENNHIVAILHLAKSFSVCMHLVPRTKLSTTDLYSPLLLYLGK